MTTSDGNDPCDTQGGRPAGPAGRGRGRISRRHFLRCYHRGRKCLTIIRGAQCSMQFTFENNVIRHHNGTETTPGKKDQTEQACSSEAEERHHQAQSPKAAYAHTSHIPRISPFHATYYPTPLVPQPISTRPHPPHSGFEQDKEQERQKKRLQRQLQRAGRNEKEEDHDSQQ
jgi:hypothetical protein